MAFSDNKELVGRQHRKEAARFIYLVRMVGAAVTDAPLMGDDLQSPAATKEFGETLTPTVATVDTDEARYPGRILFVITYVVPILRTELASL